MSDGAQIFVRYYLKETSGSPLLFIHGFGVSSVVWQPYQISLPYSSVALDLRGHGLSDKRPTLDYSPGRIIEDVIEVAEYFSLRNPIVIGWSLGGIIAQGVALSGYPISRLILMATTPAPSGPVIGLTNFGYHYLSPLIDSRPALQSIFTARSKVDLRPLLPEIRVPALILNGTADNILPVVAGIYLASHIPGAELILLPGQGHLSPKFQIEEVLEILERYLGWEDKRRNPI